MLAIPRFCEHGFDGMDRSRDWQQPYYCYDERTNPMQFSYAEGRPVRSVPHGRPDRLLPEPPDQDMPNNTQTRRRIAVACSRCRKRKIKCSGDGGTGTGCQNCRNAGVVTCNFTRVGALEVSMNQHATGIPGSYMASGHNERLQMLNSQPAYHYQSQPPLRIVTGNLPIHSYYPAENPYDTESQSEPYMLSPATPLTPSEAYAPYSLHESRHWPSYNPRYASMYPKHQGYDQAAYTPDPLTRTRALSTVMEPSGGVFATHSLHMALPSTASAPTGRELPPPASGARFSAASNTHDLVTFKPASYPKFYHALPPAQTTADARNGSISSSRSSDTLGQAPPRPSVSSSERSELLPMTLPSTSSSASDIHSAAAISDSGVNDQESYPQHGGFNVDQSLYGIPTAALSDTRLEHTGPTSNTYTFSIESRIPRTQHGLSSAHEDNSSGSSSTYIPIKYAKDNTNLRTYSLGSSSRQGNIDQRMHTLSQRSSMPSVSGQET